MRIALALEYPIATRGGVSVLVETLAEEFTRQNHEVVVVSPDSDETFRHWASRRPIAQHIPWNSFPPSPAAARRLADLLANARVQLAHFHLGGNYGWGNRFPGYCPVSHCRTRGIPCVSTVHLVVRLLEGYCGPRKPTWFKTLMFPLAWWGKLRQLRDVRAEIAVSCHDAAKLRRWYWPYRSRFVQIYHSRLRDEARLQGTAARGPVILNVGHLAWRKGQVVLAEAFARIAPHYPQWSLQLAGLAAEPEIVRQIEEIARQHHLEERIVFLGERSDALKLMRQASIYVQPSFWEALGLALQEALFCGCPAIGSRAGGIPELIDDGKTGYLVEPGNVAQLSAALEKLMSDPQRRQQWGQAAAASIRAKGMTTETMVQRHLELYAAATRRN